VLLTGVVSGDADRAVVGRLVSGVDNVRSIVNEVTVVSAQPTNTIASDALVTSKVKASLVDSKDIFAQSVKVVTEQGTVYLMGRVTEREANRATEIARGISGVDKVVRVFEVISEAELANMQTPSPPPPRPER
jgi:osmotically-inducible protein OsmY